MKLLAVGLLALILQGTTKPSSPAAAKAECKPPQYQLVNDFVDYQTGEGAVYLTISYSDTTVAKLACLAEVFEKRLHPKDVLVLIFHSREAATWFDPTGMSDGPGFRGDLRAQIELREGSATVRITPIGMMSPYFQPTWRGDAIIGEAVYDTRLPLPLPLTPHCRLEIDDRCLLALSTLQYPADLANAGIAGEVSVYVTADRTGLRTTVVAEKSAIPAALVQAAIENLKTWRLEVSTHATTFRVTLVYVLDGAFHGLYPDVAFDLPGRVTIRARRP